MSRRGFLTKHSGELSQKIAPPPPIFKLPRNLDLPPVCTYLRLIPHTLQFPYKPGVHVSSSVERGVTEVLFGRQRNRDVAYSSKRRSATPIPCSRAQRGFARPAPRRSTTRPTESLASARFFEARAQASRRGGWIGVKNFLTTASLGGCELGEARDGRRRAGEVTVDVQRGRAEEGAGRRSAAGMSAPAPSPASVPALGASDLAGTAATAGGLLTMGGRCGVQSYYAGANRPSRRPPQPTARRPPRTTRRWRRIPASTRRCGTRCAPRPTLRALARESCSPRHVVRPARRFR